jgi:hypothetical protein
MSLAVGGRASSSSFSSLAATAAAVVLSVALFVGNMLTVTNAAVSTPQEREARAMRAGKVALISGAATLAVIAAAALSGSAAVTWAVALAPFLLLAVLGAIIVLDREGILR